MAESADVEGERKKSVFSSYFAMIVVQIQHDTLELSNKCFARGLISTDSHSEVLYGSNIPKVKATTLLSAVRHSIEDQVTSFDIFLKILDEFGAYKKLTSEIRHDVVAGKGKHSQYD